MSRHATVYLTFVSIPKGRHGVIVEHVGFCTIVLVENNDTAFRSLVLNYWRAHGRHDLPWRMTTDPYAILVSEVMLQQTQVSRVQERWGAFLRMFPDVKSLASAPLAQVLRVWQGMGYNRRALNLQRMAQAVGVHHGGGIPETYSELVALPGVGPYTAGAVMAFAFGKAHPVIETNIRRVYLHHFFSDMADVADQQILPVVGRTLDHRDPRRWYWALMDYGAHLKTLVANPNRRSKHYTRQTVFVGSHRQLRAEVVRTLLLAKRGVPISRLRRLHDDPRLDDVVRELVREGFARRTAKKLYVA